MKLEIPWQCQEILDRFKEHGVQAYLVGGCVRDQLLGRKPNDWDICTEALPDQVREIFKDYKVILTGLQHGTVTVLLNSMPVEITTYRIDGEYEDNRHPKEVFFTDSLQEDLSRRDFTINAMAYHPDVGVVDYFGGMEDLKKGIVRCVGEAACRYQEDGLRILRAIRFACVLHFQFEEETEKAISDYNYLLKNIAKERIQVEFDKIITSSWAAYGLELLVKLHCMEYIIPELCHTWEFDQRGGRHQYDVFMHSVKAVSYIFPSVPLRLTMLLHDIGKPFVWQPESDRDLFPDHGRVGAELAGKILNRMRYDKKTITKVKTLIGEHERPLQPNPACVRHAVRELGEEGLRDLLEVKRADIRAHGEGKWLEVLKIFDAIEDSLDGVIKRGECCSLKELAVSGKDMVSLGFRGKEVGEVLNNLLEEVLQEPDKNNREYLLQEAQEWSRDL